MSRAPAIIQAEMQALSPPGYSRSPDAVWGKQLAPAAAESALIEQMGEALHAEIDPRQTAYLLPEWQAEFGADPYGVDTSNMITPQLQAYLYQRLTSRGGQSKQFYIDLATAMGVAITISESVLTVYDDAVYDDAVYVEPPEQFRWVVTLPTQLGTDGTYDDLQYDEPSGTFVENPVVPIITALAPAHTQVIFSYTG